MQTAKERAMPGRSPAAGLSVPAPATGQRCWLVQQRSIPLPEVPDTRRPTVLCHAAVSRAQASQAKEIATAVVNGTKPIQDVLQSSAELPAQVLLHAACRLLNAAAKGPGPTGANRMLPSSQLAARHLLLILESRPYEVKQLPRTIHQALLLCQLIVQLNGLETAPEGTLDAAQATASARVRWPTILSWVGSVVRAQQEPLDTPTALLVLRALSTSGHPTHPSTLAPLVQGLSQQQQTQPADTVDTQPSSQQGSSILLKPAEDWLHAAANRSPQPALAAGLGMVSQLQLTAGRGRADTLQASLKDAMSRADSKTEHDTLAQLAQAAVATHTQITDSFAQLVFDAAAKAAVAGAAAGNSAAVLGAAGLLAGCAHQSPASTQAFRQLCRSLIGGTQADTAQLDAFLMGVGCAGSVSGDVAQALADAAVRCGNAAVVAAVLHTLRGHRSAADSCKGLLAWLTERVGDLTIQQLCTASAAALQLSLADSPAVQPLIDRCQQVLSSHGNSDTPPSQPAVKPDLLLDIATAGNPAHSTELRQTALHAWHSSQGRSHTPDSAASAVAAPSWLQAAHARAQKERVLRHLACVADAAWQARLGSEPLLADLSAALLQQAGTAAPAMRAAEVLNTLQLASQLPAAVTAQQSQARDVLCLVLWGWVRRMGTPQICAAMDSLARLGWRPKPAVAAMTRRVSAAVARHETYARIAELSSGSDDSGSSGSEDAAGADASGDGSASGVAAEQARVVNVALVEQATGFACALVRLGVQNSAAERLLQLTSAAAVRSCSADAAQPAAQLRFMQPDAPAAPADAPASTTPPVTQDAAQPAQHTIKVETLTRLLWCHAKQGISTNRSLQLVRSLLLAIMQHATPCSLVQLGRVWWSAATLKFTGSRLSAWLIDTTCLQLQQHAAAPTGAVDAAAASRDGLALAEISAALRQMQLDPGPRLLWLTARAAATLLPHMPAAAVTQVVYHLVQRSRRGPAQLSEAVGELAAAAAAQLRARLAEFHTPAAVYLAWAIARAGLTVDTATLDSIATRFLQTSMCRDTAAVTAAADASAGKHIDDVLLSEFLWTCGVCRHQPQQLLDSYAARLPARLCRSGRDARESAALVSAAVFGLASCKYRSRAAIEALSDGLYRWHQFFTGKQLSQCLYGLALLGHCPVKAWQSGVLVPVIRDRAPGMKLQELAHTLWALSQWPMEKIVGRQRLDLIREAMRPVLLVHVLSAQVTATAAYDAAGERTVPPEPAPAAAADDSPAAAATAPAAAQPGVPFGRLPGGSGLQPIDPTRVLMQQLPPLAKDAIVDIAVGTASLGVCTPDMAEALTGWAMSVPAGGLSRFTNRQLCSLLWAFAECRHDRLSLFEGAAEIIAARVAAAAAGGAAAGGLSGQSYARMTDKDMQKLLWAWAKFNRHPGEELLEAVRLRWSQLTASNGQDTSAGDGEAGAAAAAAGVGPALDVVCSLIYSLAVLREHRHPFMQLLCSQLGQLLGQQVQLQPAGTASAAAQQGEGEGEAGVAVVTAVAERLQSHGPQLAAAMLAAQSENQDSPLVHVLPDKLRHETVNAWRQKAQTRVQAPSGFVRYLKKVVTSMGLPNRIQLTADGIVCPDLTVGSPMAPGVRFALELVGPHNTAANSGRLLGDAALKYRLLQARGYLVIPISCKEWTTLPTNFDKAAYVEAKLERRLAALSATASPAAADGAPAAAAAAVGAPVPAAAIAAAAADTPAVNGAAAPAAAAAAAVSAPTVNVSTRAVPDRIQATGGGASGSAVADGVLLKPAEVRPTP